MRSAEVAGSNETLTKSKLISASRFIARIAARIDESRPPENKTYTDAGFPKTISGIDKVLLRTHYVSIYPSSSTN